MSLNNDGFIDPDEALRLLELAAGEDAGRDMVLRIDNGGTSVEGESTRVFEDGKPRLNLRGYQFAASATAPPGSTRSKVSVTWLVAVRDSDAATASIASLLNNGAEELTVTVSVFRAGGDPSQDEQPTLEIELSQARVRHHVLLTGGQPRRPMEIAAFSFVNLAVRSAPQRESGLRGAVRSCTYG